MRRWLTKAMPSSASLLTSRNDCFGAYLESAKVKDRQQMPLWVLEYESFRLLGTLDASLRQDHRTRHLFWASSAVSGLAATTGTDGQKNNRKNNNNNGTSAGALVITQEWVKTMYIGLVLLHDGDSGRIRQRHINMLSSRLVNLCDAIGIVGGGGGGGDPPPSERLVPFPVLLSGLRPHHFPALCYLVHLSSAWLVADVLHDADALRLLEAELVCAILRIGTE
ncbi:hypothetical protein PWT90_09561 [Aphanocladium album]|nr:hypothetical protein PWT90_09561 [Aphanocladium album]